MIVNEILTNKIIEKLEQGCIPWHKPWKGGASGTPKNFITKKPYRGINIILLGIQEHTCPYWATFKQINKLKGHVKKGEKGTIISFYKTYTKKVKNENNENNELEEKNSYTLRYYNVFNLEQTENIDYEKPNTDININEFNPIDTCDKIINSMPNSPNIEHKQQRAFYMPSKDIVNMPKKNSFNMPEEYYSTLFHELGHSTGHKSRLNRDQLHKNHMFGSQDYSKEELVAELTSCFLCGYADIEKKVIDNSASYIQSWLKKLKNDSNFILNSASLAQKAYDYILDK